MESKHTPGPWGMDTVKTQVGCCYKIGVFPSKVGHDNFACVYADGCRVDEDSGIAAELKANARLIASAPELLEALEIAKNGLMWFREQYPDEVNECDHEAMQQIEAAIAKATGK